MDLPSVSFASSNELAPECNVPLQKRLFMLRKPNICESLTELLIFWCERFQPLNEFGGMRVEQIF